MERGFGHPGMTHNRLWPVVTPVGLRHLWCLGANCWRNLSNGGSNQILARGQIKRGPRGSPFYMAVGQGFEPREGINPQRFSRPPLSTTQPAHQKQIVPPLARQAALYSATPCVQGQSGNPRGKPLSPGPLRAFRLKAVALGGHCWRGALYGRWNWQQVPPRRGTGSVVRFQSRPR